MSYNRRNKQIATLISAAMATIMILSFVFLGKNVLAADYEPNQIIGATNWQGTFVYDEKGNDVTAANANFIGRAKYDAKTNRYEFFDTSNVTRGDKGVFFMTQDGKKRILMSELGYRAVVDNVRLDKDMYTYRRAGVQKDGTQGFVFVEHIPFDGELTFTSPAPELTQETGTIVKDQPGRTILSVTKWQGTKVFDTKGNDVSASNGSFLGLARYESKTGIYEFFNTEGASRGDYGYYDVINGNKERTHLSVGSNYGATLELTELNNERFTYARMGVDVDGEPGMVTVEHEPYTGTHALDFTFKPATELIVQPSAKTEHSNDSTDSNAVVEVESTVATGSVKFNEDANTEASIVFAKINTKDKQTVVPENQLGKAVISVIDTRTDATNATDWNVISRLSDGPFGNKGFLLNNLGVVLSPTTTEASINVENKVTMNSTDAAPVFKVGFAQGSNERKAVVLNPELTVADTNSLQSGVYGANITWTLTPEVR